LNTERMIDHHLFLVPRTSKEQEPEEYLRSQPYTYR
jgi:hypothetical protein